MKYLCTLRNYPIWSALAQLNYYCRTLHQFIGHPLLTHSLTHSHTLHTLTQAMGGGQSKKQQAEAAAAREAEEAEDKVELNFKAVHSAIR